jgi:putative hydrolase of the HAD superfamily
MKQFTGIRAVTFDVGSTLIEPWPSVGHVYAEVAAAHGHGTFSADELDHRFRATFRSFGGLVNTKSEWARIVDETFAGLLPEPPSRTFFPELYERFAQGSAWRIYDDVAPTVAALSQRGLKLGVISNWDDRLRPLLKSLQLGDRFEIIVVSCEVGASKPAPAIFKVAVEKLGVPAAAILHVGDSLELDVEGARAAGLNAVQIKREAIQGDGIKSLLDLLTLV